MEANAKTVARTNFFIVVFPLSDGSNANDVLQKNLYMIVPVYTLNAKCRPIHGKCLQGAVFRGADKPGVAESPGHYGFLLRMVTSEAAPYRVLRNNMGRLLTGTGKYPPKPEYEAFHIQKMSKTVACYSSAKV
ncbi:hypothetical protein GHO43_19600 [Pseudomonas sp. FSL R10-0071]|uniref:hypothetical protein n=1 Tax=Pseudomonas sp. FSL R10-0071 TaxID=2662193 RepID=UPI00135FD161|nr:hypothetical protein [Pseudomonas sp. FSL R10-0071]MQT70221.1 hypothetical protein [Pseudomonas sp. FSL R10-0071]